MTAIADLVKWIFVFAFAGGFWHFVGTCLILSYLTRIFNFVRVRVDKKKDYSKKSTDDE